MVGLGLGGPIALAYLGAEALPSTVLPAWYIFDGIVTGPFTFGVNYWTNAKMKPFFSLSSSKPEAPRLKTPVDKETARIASSHTEPDAGTTSPIVQVFKRIGSSSTGVSDQDKDGRNIAKDSEIQLRDSLNDAIRITNDDDAHLLFAASLLNNAEAFPEARINPLSALQLHLKVKDRFANPTAYNRIRELIRLQASTRKIDSRPALINLDIILQPEEWRKP